ncbi:MAG: hypothetical protein ACOX23_02990 [Peptococcia bacterium]|jgi:hypothetical protein
MKRFIGVLVLVLSFILCCVPMTALASDMNIGNFNIVEVRQENVKDPSKVSIIIQHDAFDLDRYTNRNWIGYTIYDNNQLIYKGGKSKKITLNVSAGTHVFKVGAHYKNGKEKINNRSVVYTIPEASEWQSIIVKNGVVSLFWKNKIPKANIKKVHIIRETPFRPGKPIIDIFTVNVVNNNASYDVSTSFGDRRPGSGINKYSIVLETMDGHYSLRSKEVTVNMKNGQCK